MVIVKVSEYVCNILIIICCKIDTTVNVLLYAVCTEDLLVARRALQAISRRWIFTVHSLVLTL